MNFIRRKAFCLSYLGALLFILSTFVPIIKIENQTVAFIDQFLYLSIAIGVFSTLIIIFTTIKQYKISLIPTFLNIGIVAFGIYKIMTIENLQVTINLDLGSYGIAFILYPIAALLSILGALLQKKDIVKNEKVKMHENKTINHVEEIAYNSEEDINEKILLDDVEQIPLSNIIKQNDDNQEFANDSSEIQKNDSSIDQIIDYESEININNNINIEQKSEIQNEFNNNINLYENNNDILEPKVNLDQNLSFDETTIVNNVDDSNRSSENNATETDLIVDDEIILPNEISIDNDTVLINEQENILNEENEIAEVHISNLGDDDLITPEEYPTNEFINIDNNSDEEIIFEDIIENQNIPELELSSNSDLEQEVPDMSIDDNFMTNNIQVMEEPEKQFMAINPTDIKIDEKKTLFKKKEKKEEDPLVKIMNRNIPTTLGRKCQFCSTQLGDDERICPLCGRIN